MKSRRRNGHLEVTLRLFIPCLGTFPICSVAAQLIRTTIVRRFLAVHATPGPAASTESSTDTTPHAFSTSSV
jgi:hypothetical protein